MLAVVYQNIVSEKQ